MESVQIIKENDQPKYAVIDCELFVKLCDQLEELEDYIELQKILNEPITEIIPLNVYKFIKNPIKALRIEYSLTQKQLAEIMKVSQPYIAKVEKAENPPKDFIEKVKKTIKK